MTDETPIRGYTEYAWYTVKEDTDSEDYKFWAGGSLDDKGEDVLNRKEPLQFFPHHLPVGARVILYVPNDDAASGEPINY